MASESKKAKLRNSYLCKSGLKNKVYRLKGTQFFTSAERQFGKKFVKNWNDEDQYYEYDHVMDENGGIIE